MAGTRRARKAPAAIAAGVEDAIAAPIESVAAAADGGVSASEARVRSMDGLNHDEREATRRTTKHTEGTESHGGRKTRRSSPWLSVLLASSVVRSLSVAGTRARVLPTGRRAWRLSLLLAIALSLAALAAVGVDRVLSFSLRTPTATDEASLACAYLLNGDYDALASQMDPAPDGASTGRFDPAAFAADLRAQDARDGRVTSCALRQMEPDAGAQVVIYAMTVRRTGLSYPLGSLVVVRHEADGRWLLARASTFYYQLG
jgi:hypothetical protein